MSKKIIIADDHPVFLLGLRMVLSGMPENYQIVGEAHHVSGLLSLLQTKPLDMLITDFIMPGHKDMDGLRMISYIRKNWPTLLIVLITMVNESNIISMLSRYNVKPILNKSSLASELEKGLYNTAGQEQPYISSDFLSSSIDQLARILTPKELEVIRLLAKGLTVNDIATKVFRTKQTISSQKQSVMKKLNIPNDVALYNYLQQVGLSG
ncbi:Transcriptional regulatory protein RcsB [Arsenophonus endosymbiont of Aleurodicus floccissimus]|uniref:response regulator n=1 Tax=Arsenophonus endosymbiont of Aleurodicus floccissimus TaxID=2152761 RepID=UPI000E6B4BAC|nr:response regulator [Arsenophonus endosymbiont of Aleurodicus floccissimus]SPP32159.1 Transcriptional regulatory protein RcsB [Arsenophonus endosymbiont of Aleurodicus floccissimus]